jgi:hypothetical protein
MKTKAIVATLLVAAAASAQARLASPYPRKPLPPDEIGHWIVINGNPWSHDTKPGPDGLKSSSLAKKKHTARLECFIRVCGRSPLGRRDRIRSHSHSLSVTKLTMKRSTNATIYCVAPPPKRSSARPSDVTLIAGWQGGLKHHPGFDSGSCGCS